MVWLIVDKFGIPAGAQIASSILRLESSISIILFHLTNCLFRHLLQSTKLFVPQDLCSSIGQKLFFYSTGQCTEYGINDSTWV
jgi:hypothetical protein